MRRAFRGGSLDALACLRALKCSPSPRVSGIMKIPSLLVNIKAVFRVPSGTRGLMTMASIEVGALALH